MFSPMAFENSRPGGIGVLEIPTEQLPRAFVPLRRTELRGEVAGPLAALRLIQVYGYSREQSEQVLEAIYRFPLPGDAAVTGVRVRFGDVEIVATLKERAQAEETYAEAKREGRQAALLSRESPDVFTLQVAGIRPDEEITIETAYVQLARSEGGGWSLRVPLTTSPRYARSDESGSRHAEGQPLLLMRDPGHRFSMDVTLRGAGSVTSPTHKLALKREGGTMRVRLEGGDVLPDRDCLLAWQPAQEQGRPALTVLTHPDGEHLYFLALVAPPASDDLAGGVAREVVLLVDHSGSMSGPKWEAADWAVKQFLGGLSERDSFDLALFHTSTRWFEKRLCSGSRRHIDEAIAFLERHKDSGGTELGVALEQALEIKRAAGEQSRHVLIITDAEVTDAGRVLRLASEEAEHPQRRRISVLCIDAAPNSFLAHELAERGGGVARFLTSAPEEEDITTALDEVLADWAAPVLAGLTLEVGREGVSAAGRQVRAGGGGIDLGDLPAGRPLWVVGRVPRGGEDRMALRVVDGRGREVATWDGAAAESAGENPAIKALFGARRVLGLEFLIGAGYTGDELRDQLTRLGYDPDAALAAGQPRKLYAENARRDASAALKDLLVREALDYGLASAETAFVAVRSEAGKPVEGTVAVANALPAGWSDAFAGGAPRAGQMMFAAAAMPVSMPPPSPMMGPPPAAAASTPPVPGFLRRRKTGARPPADIRSAAPMAEMDEVAAPKPPSRPLFAGAPGFAGGEAELFDSRRQTGALPAAATISRLTLSLPGGGGEAVDPGLTLLLYVGDLASPRARVRLADVLRQGGARPLNLALRPGDVVRIVLADPGGAWAAGAPQIELGLEWR